MDKNVISLLHILIILIKKKYVLFFLHIFLCLSQSVSLSLRDGEQQTAGWPLRSVARQSTQAAAGNRGREKERKMVYERERERERETGEGQSWQAA